MHFYFDFGNIKYALHNKFSFSNFLINYDRKSKSEKVKKTIDFLKSRIRSSNDEQIQNDIDVSKQATRIAQN